MPKLPEWVTVARDSDDTIRGMSREEQAERAYRRGFQHGVIAALDCENKHGAKTTAYRMRVDKHPHRFYLQEFLRWQK